MANVRAPVARPLSPHLQIYRYTMPFLMSGFHRVTGAVLYLGMLVPVVWLLAMASGPEWYDLVNGLLGSILGHLVLLGFSWGLIHHMLSGIRHLIWDTGRGLDVPSVRRFAWATLIGSVSLTLLVWIAAFALGGL